MITWYVDDFKISHVQIPIVDNIIVLIESPFGKMTVTRGNKHSYFGIDIEFQINRNVTLLQKHHCIETIDTFGEDISSPVSPASQIFFFNVDNNTDPLSTDKGINFHSVVQKLLVVAKRAMPDIQPTISFLCNRVQDSNISDRRKLKMILQFINGTIDEKLTLSTDKD